MRRVTEIARGVLMVNFCEVNTRGWGTTQNIHLHIAMKPQPTDINGAPLPWEIEHQALAFCILAMARSENPSYII